MESYKLNENDFVLYKKDGAIQNGGFSLDSLLKNQKGGNKSDIVDSTYVVPSGLFHSEKKHTLHKSTNDTDDETPVISDELYENLISMASVKENKTKSNKNESFKKRKYTKRLQKTNRETRKKK